MIKRGVSLYSYQQAQFFKQMSWKDQIVEVHDNLKCDGIVKVKKFVNFKIVVMLRFVHKM